MKAYAVYYLDQENPKVALTDDLKGALDRAKELRNGGFHHVVLSVQDRNDALEDADDDSNWRKLQ